MELTAVRGISALQLVTNHYLQFVWFRERKGQRTQEQNIRQGEGKGECAGL